MYRWNFQRIARRRALSVARMNAAPIGRLDSRGMVDELRLSVGSITPEPSRMTGAENHLKGKVPDPLLIQEAAGRKSHWRWSAEVACVPRLSINVLPWKA